MNIEAVSLEGLQKAKGDTTTPADKVVAEQSVFFIKGVKIESYPLGTAILFSCLTNAVEPQGFSFRLVQTKPLQSIVAHVRTIKKDEKTKDAVIGPVKLESEGVFYKFTSVTLETPKAGSRK
jgi:hypothetical protein